MVIFIEAISICDIGVYFLLSVVVQKKQEPSALGVL